MEYCIIQALNAEASATNEVFKWMDYLNFFSNYVLCTCRRTEYASPADVFRLMLLLRSKKRIPIFALAKSSECTIHCI